MSTTSPKQSSRRAAWAGFRSLLRWLPLLLLAAALWLVLPAGRAAAPDEAVQTLTRVQALLEPEGLPAETRELTLPFRWDKAFPGRGGRATFRVVLPVSPALQRGQMAVLLDGVGNQAEVSVNGVVEARLGTLGDPAHDAAKASHVILLSTLPLQAAASGRELTIVATIQRQRGAGLAPILLGAEQQLWPLQITQRRWRTVAALVYAVSLLLMGGLAAGLWWRQRDALYGCFSLAAFSGMVRNLDRAWPDVPLPWPFWGAVVAVCYAVHIALIARFVLLALERNPPWLVRGLYAVLAAAVVLASASFLFALPMLWTVGLTMLQLLSMACLPLVVVELRHNRAPVIWALLVAGVLSIAAGAYDLLVVRMGLLGGSTFTLTPHAVFVFVLILAGLVVERYSHTLRDYRALNASLAAQVADREAQLRQAFEALQAQRQEQAVLHERQRMMREIHDGVGSQLVGLLNVVTQPASDRSTMAEHVKLALDEMRMAVDSLQPGHDDIGTVLATLRYRLQARLDAAGIALGWDVETLPFSVPVTAQEALQVQRIVLEAITNVLKHAHATRIDLKAGCEDAPTGRIVTIAIADNGVGCAIGANGGPVAGPGHGLNNMHSRAVSLGAELRVAPAAGGGTAVTLVWPLAAS